jgi:hypothetical protein
MEDKVDADAASVVVIETAQWFTCVESEKKCVVIVYTKATWKSTIMRCLAHNLLTCWRRLCHCEQYKQHTYKYYRNVTYLTL